MLYLALALGGAFGAITRYLLYQSTAYWETAFPYPTLMINLAGCLVLGFFFTLTLDYVVLHPAIRIGFGTGFVGAFTTFSTFSVENLGLIQQGELTLSLLYVLVSLFGGLLCAGIGIHSARWMARRRLRG